MNPLHLIKLSLIAGTFALTFSGVTHAAGEVTSVSVSESRSTPYRYDHDGLEYTWGMGANQLLESITVDGYSYSYASPADRVVLRRDDIPGVTTGTPCGIFAERLSTSSEVLSADYPSDAAGTGNCDMAQMLSSRIMNRGALDIFSNKVPNPKNVERVDYIYDTGITTPLDADALNRAGHVVAEKRGNNPIQIAAVLSLDSQGNPAAYGPLVRVNEADGCTAAQICYGTTNLRHNYVFFQSSSSGPQGYPSFLKESTESLAMAFVSTKALGLIEGQRYYGFSYFPEDVNSEEHSLVDPSTFPDDTADDGIVPGDSADIYGGVSGFFVGDNLSTGTGSLYNDVNGDGQRDVNEAGLGSITLTLHADTNGNGVYDQGVDAQVGETLESDITGSFTLPGLTDQTYFLLVDANDSDIPPGLFLPEGSNPALIQVSGGDVPDINFGFIGSNFFDPNSTAIPDTASVLQGSTVDIDVLANDVDVPALGLTLVSVGNSGNASISIVGNQVSYTPSYGFYGTDTFIYVMADSDGDESSTTVTVTVNRFSDINDNALNDFDECACSDLSIETGIHGSGLGKLPVDLLLLMGVVGLTRRFKLAKSGAAS